MLNLTIVTGNPGSGRTGFLFKNLKKNEDNFVITTDSSVYYIERLMSEKGFPGKCVGINSLAKNIHQEIGGIIEDIISEEMQIILITDIMKENYDKLSTLKVISYNNTIVNNISKFINECLIQEIYPDDLFNIIDKLGALTYVKLKDIAIIYKEYLKILEKKCLLNSVLFSRKIIKLLDNKEFKFKNIYIDSLNKYNPLSLGLIKALVKNSDESMVIFSTVSTKSYLYNIYKNNIDAYIDFDEYVTSLEDITINRITLKKNREQISGIDIIKDELFNRDTKTEGTTEDVFLHEASTIYKEIDFVSSKIKELVSDGYSYDDIILTGTDLDLYKNIINNTFAKRGINCYYYKNKKISQTVFYSFLDNIFKIIVEGFKVEYILNLVNINYFNLSDEEIHLVNSYFLRFGNDLNIALKNGEIYDNDNYVYVNLVIEKIKNFINVLKESFEKSNKFSDFSLALFEYWDYLKLEELFFNQYNNLLSSKPQLANEIVETWNGFVNILDIINNLDDNKTYTIKNFIDVFSKLCNESNIINSQEYCDEIKVLDLKDAQNRKSKVCFIIGCNEGKFPFDVSEVCAH